MTSTGGAILVRGGPGPFSCMLHGSESALLLRPKACVTVTIP